MRSAFGLGQRARTVAVGAQQIRDPFALGILESRGAVFAAEALVGAVVADRPLDVNAIGRKALVQLVGHGAVEVAVIRARVRAELAEVEAGVARFERVHRPRDDLDALVEAVVALSLLQLLREAASAVRITNREHVRMVPEVVIMDSEESEDEARGHRVLGRVPARDEPAVVHDREHELRRHDHVPAPGLLLKGDGRRAACDVVGHLYAEFGHG